MLVPLNPSARSRRRRRALRAGGFTLIEIMMSLGVLALGTMGGISAFLLLNRYAANLRNMSVARSLCQERIEQALTLAFRPPNSIVPLAPNADPSTKSANSTLPILGAATYYSPTTSIYSGGNNLQTSTENIPVYTQSDGTSANNSANVTYVRTTTVSPAPLYYANAGGTTTTSLNVVQLVVSVSYVFHGQSYSASMSTLRGPD